MTDLHRLTLAMTILGGLWLAVLGFLVYLTIRSPHPWLALATSIAWCLILLLAARTEPDGRPDVSGARLFGRIPTEPRTHIDMPAGDVCANLECTVVYDGPLWAAPLPGLRRPRGPLPLSKLLSRLSSIPASAANRLERERLGFTND